MRYLQKMLFTLVGIPALVCLIGITFLASSSPVFSQQFPLKIYIDADRTGAAESGISIEQGVRAGLASYGNQLNGRDVEVVIRDHQGSTPRSKRHLNEFLKDKDALLVVSGLHSPPLLANRDFINENKILTLDPWTAAGPITRPLTEENWIFRLSVDDTKAGESYAATVRKSDTVARMGGDEFAVILSSIKNPVDAASVAKKLLKSCSEVKILDKEIPVSASVGISVHQSDGLTKDELFKHADLAMYRAKQSELGVCFYSDSMNSRAEMRVSLERELIKAIAENQFVLHYQPKVCCMTGAILGAEALIRWQHPDKGLLYPNAFLRVTEEVGLTAKLGNWVIRQTMSDAAYLKSRGIENLRLAINVSALQLRHHEVDKELEKSLSDLELSPVMFEVELTENFLIKSDDDDVDRLHEIQQLGVSLAIDDFGTGFSSIAYLHTLPIETVKIDRSFVNSIGQTMEGASLVGDMIRMAHGQGLKVVAEGVETDEQLTFLREAGCDLYQGFLMSPAIPIDELVEMVEVDMGRDIA